MQYMCLIYSAEGSRPRPDAYIHKYQTFTQMASDGRVIKAGEPLQPMATATTVSRENGSIEISDGPFAETKEQLGGNYLLDCKNVAEALEYAAKIPSAEHELVEVRPCMVFDNLSIHQLTVIRQHVATTPTEPSHKPIGSGGVGTNIGFITSTRASDFCERSLIRKGISGAQVIV